MEPCATTEKYWPIDQYHSNFADFIAFCQSLSILLNCDDFSKIEEFLMNNNFFRQSNYIPAFLVLLLRFR